MRFALRVLKRLIPHDLRENWDSWGFWLALLVIGLLLGGAISWTIQKWQEMYVH